MAKIPTLYQDTESEDDFVNVGSIVLWTQSKFLQF